jgi:hypothetical protein
MKRREFSLAVTSVASAWPWAPLRRPCPGAAPKEGKDYIKLASPPA